MIDIAIDGADQVDPQVNLVKGGGGRCSKKKSAAAAKQFVVMVDHEAQNRTPGKFCRLKWFRSDGVAPHATSNKPPEDKPCCANAPAPYFKPRPAMSSSISICRRSTTRPHWKSGESNPRHR